MNTEMAEAIKAGRDGIIRAWVARARQSSEKHRALPPGELEATAGRLLDGIVEALTTGNYVPLEEALIGASEDRARRGFGVAEVQRALMMGCEAILPVLQRAFESDAQRLVWAISQIERVMQRSVQILNRSFERARAGEAQATLDAALADCAAHARRLQALVQLCGQAAIVVDRELMVVWVDERAESPQHGMYAPGDIHPCAAEACDAECILARAFETGEVQRRDPAARCKVAVAAPVRSAEGEVVEVIGLL